MDNAARLFLPAVRICHVVKEILKVGCLKESETSEYRIRDIIVMAHQTHLINPFSEGVLFRRQNLTSEDVRF